MKRIICPIDFSANSLNAAKYAARLAFKINLPVNMVFLTGQPKIQKAEPAGIVEETEAIDEDIEFKLQQFCAELTETYLIQCSNYIISNSELSVAIHDLGDEVELVVIGTDKERQLMENMRDSTSYELLKTIDKPVLIVPEECEFRNIDRIVYGTKYGALDLPVLKKLTELFDVFNPDIYVVHMSNRFDFQKTNEFKNYCRSIEEAMPGEDRLHFHHIHGTEIPNALINFSLDVKNQIIAVTTDYDNIYQKARVEKLTKIMDRPILMMPGSRNL